MTLLVLTAICFAVLVAYTACVCIALEAAYRFVEFVADRFRQDDGRAEHAEGQ